MTVDCNLSSWTIFHSVKLLHQWAIRNSYTIHIKRSFLEDASGCFCKKRALLEVQRFKIWIMIHSLWDHKLEEPKWPVLWSGEPSITYPHWQPEKERKIGPNDFLFAVGRTGRIFFLNIPRIENGENSHFAPKFGGLEGWRFGGEKKRIKKISLPSLTTTPKWLVVANLVKLKNKEMLSRSLMIKNLYRNFSWMSFGHFEFFCESQIETLFWNQQRKIALRSQHKLKSLDSKRGLKLLEIVTGN